MRFSVDGDPSLLVWRVPGELTEEQAQVQVYAVPIMSRHGGVLIAIPEQVLSSEAILDGLVQESLLGPSKEFQALLCVEDDVGHVTDLALHCTFLVIDVEDMALQQMREYDPVTDSTEAIRPFSLEHINALPKISDITAALQEWLTVVAHEKLNFYSAREEQELPDKPAVAAPKKAAAKKASRRTNADLSDRLDALSAQVQMLLGAKQEASAMAPSTAPGFAGIANGPSPGPLVAKVPSLSAAIPCGIRPKDARALLGPPPKAKPVQDSGVGHADLAGDPALSATGGSNGAAECGNQSTGSTHRFRRRCRGRPCRIFQFAKRPFIEYQRRCQKRANADGISKPEFQLLRPGAKPVVSFDAFIPRNQFQRPRRRSTRAGSL